MDYAVGYISSFKKNDVERSVELKIQADRIKEFCIEKDYIEYLYNLISKHKGDIAAVDFSNNKKEKIK